MGTFINAWTNVVVISGAGFSAPSGMPVYRGDRDGLERAGWFTNKIAAKMHRETYAAHLDENWSHWQELIDLALDASPHEGHHALVRWERVLTSRTHPGSLTIVTQNVDGLHQRAGSSHVLDVHGTILISREIATSERFPSPHSDAHETLPPAAPNGSRATRPDIVLFGEHPRQMTAAIDAVKGADLVVFAGTSGRVWPVAGLLQIANSQRRTTTMLLNLEPWEHGTFDVIVLDDVRALDQLVP